jgi:prevent-host-death family protein
MFKSVTATELKRNTSDLFNSVQSFGAVKITNKSRPEMVLMLKDSHDTLIQTAKDQSEKIKQLTELVKKLDGDAKNQLDMLKG